MAKYTKRELTKGITNDGFVICEKCKEHIAMYKRVEDNKYLCTKCAKEVR